MNVTEKVSYIKGLAEGLGIDDSTKEGKVLAAIIDVLDDIAHDLEDIDDELNDVADVMTDVEESLCMLEDDIYGDEDDCCCDDCEDMYEITCPACDNSITVDYDVISSGSITCPNCGANLEPDLSGLDDEVEEPEQE
ncbi:MAG: hypothetical protein J1E39_07915 [Eubacterium sp.]|nr:hypothetical protein [Eubacterium sp.]